MKLTTILGIVVLLTGIAAAALSFYRSEQVTTYLGPDMYGNNFWLHPYTKQAASVVKTTTYTGEVLNIYQKEDTSSTYIQLNTADSSGEGTAVDIELPDLIEPDSIYVTNRSGMDVAYSRVEMDDIFTYLADESYILELSISQIISDSSQIKYISHIQFTQ